jgi:hypothetical protein
MGNHTWFYRPVKEDELPSDTCEYSDEVFGEDLYTDIDTPHDLFRIGKYCEDKLLSLEQTLQFIDSKKEQIYHFVEDWEINLKEFWDKNPNGVIEFG